jgi:hypothetical protein
MKRKRFLLFLISIFGTFLFLLNQTVPCDASLSVSITSDIGNNSLKFSRSDLQTPSSKEVRIRVSSSDNTQYQVFQRIIDPFVNEQGMFYDQPFLQYYGQAGSNSSGTLYGQAPAFIFRSDQLVYTSSQTGETDAFTLYYYVDPQRLTSSGRFFGKILFSVRPLGTGSQAEAFLEVNVDSSGEFNVEVQTSRGGKLLRLGTAGQDMLEDMMTIEFSGNNNGSLKITQEIQEYPHSETNEFLPKDAVKYSVSNKENKASSSLDFLSNKSEVLFNSQSLADTISVNFFLNEAVRDKLLATIYKGVINYRIESLQETRNVPIDLEIAIPPIFELSLKIISGSMSFSHLIADEPPQFKEVEINIKSNLGKPYMVIQKVTDVLRNASGEKIDEQFFTMSEVISESEPGEISHKDFIPVRAGEETIFVSNSGGQSATFKQIFRLQPYRGMAPGEYLSIIEYSLVEI